MPPTIRLYRGTSPRSECRCSFLKTLCVGCLQALRSIGITRAFQCLLSSHSSTSCCTQPGPWKSLTQRNQNRAVEWWRYQASDPMDGREQWETSLGSDRSTQPNSIVPSGKALSCLMAFYIAFEKLPLVMQKSCNSYSPTPWEVKFCNNCTTPGHPVT